MIDSNNSLDALEVLELTRLELEKIKLAKEISDINNKLLIEDLSRKVNILELNARKRSLNDQRNAANLRNLNLIKTICEKYDILDGRLGWDPETLEIYRPGDEDL